MKKPLTPTPIDYYAPMHEGKYYHVYNRTNNKELLFRDDYDRSFFLKRLEKYISPYADIYSYCLLGNHFHLQIRVKSIEVIEVAIKKLRLKDRSVSQKLFLETPSRERMTAEVLLKQFGRCFISYARYFNNRYKRNGNLFTRRFKRLEVKNDAHFIRLIYYIHSNPVKHKLVRSFKKYRWSSYLVILSNEPTFLARRDVFEWFSGRDKFIEFHHRNDDTNDDMKVYLLEE